jgi:alpha-glucuronidase
VAALVFALLAPLPAGAEDGYELWLRYRPVADPELRQHYRATIAGLLVEGDSPAC